MATQLYSVIQIVIVQIKQHDRTLEHNCGCIYYQAVRPRRHHIGTGDLCHISHVGRGRMYGANDRGVRRRYSRWAWHRNGAFHIIEYRTWSAWREWRCNTASELSDASMCWLLRVILKMPVALLEPYKKWLAHCLSSSHPMTSPLDSTYGFVYITIWLQTLYVDEFLLYGMLTGLCIPDCKAAVYCRSGSTFTGTRTTIGGSRQWSVSRNSQLLASSTHSYYFFQVVLLWWVPIIYAQYCCLTQNQCVGNVPDHYLVASFVYLLYQWIRKCCCFTCQPLVRPAEYYPP